MRSPQEWVKDLLDLQREGTDEQLHAAIATFEREVKRREIARSTPRGLA